MLTSEQKIKIERYLDLLFHWNKKINLTSRDISRADFYQQHVEDCLFLAELLMTQKNGVTGKEVLDIGSGNGLPGIILAITTNFFITMVERNHKKTAFLNFVIGELNLTDRAQVIACDALEYPKLTSYRKPEIIVSKAVGDMSLMLQLSKPNLQHGDEELYLLKNTSQINAEINEVANWSFNLKNYPNKYKHDSVVVHISDIKFNGPSDAKQGK